MATTPQLNIAGGVVAEWVADLLYRQISDELLCDPLPSDPTSDADWFAPGPVSRIDGWCEDRDPRTLTDLDGRE